ncbi:MAG: hypothetical protein HC927_13915, partial [Deltaproteobacteria bacterium]|nr:hypothetical protein [Deltaproteobacteria bacterium]
MKLVHDRSVLVGLLLLSLAPSPVGEIDASAASEPNPELVAAEQHEDERRIRGGWLALRPATFVVPFGRGSATQRFRAAVGPSYRWGFSAGASFEPRPGLLLGIAAGFDHTLWSFRSPAVPEGSDEPDYAVCFRGGCYGWTERVVGSMVRVGLELRIGHVGRHHLVWASVEP